MTTIHDAAPTEPADGTAAAAARARLASSVNHSRFGRLLVEALLAEHDALRTENENLRGRPAAQPLTVGLYDEPQTAGAVVAIHYGNYRDQELWVRSGTNDGCWYLLGGEHGRRIDDGIPRPPQHPVWQHVLARGPVTLLSAGQHDAYATGWANGRCRLLEQTEQLMHAENEPPTTTD